MRFAPLHFVYLGIVLTGCSGYNRSGTEGSSPSQESSVMKLHSGKEVLVLGIGKLSFSNDSPALMLKYQTELSIDDREALRKEVDEVWEQFQPDVEKAGLVQGIVSANEPPKGGFIKHNRTFNFVYKKMPSGKWEMQ
jgi:hypothetical protein